MLLLTLVTVALALSASEAQIVGTGSCPEVTLLQNFDPVSYLGVWYEQARYYAVFEENGDCVTAEYTDLGGGVVGVTNTMTNLETGEVSVIEGTATLDGDTTEGRLLVYFASVGNFSAPYWILDSDYENYSVVWSCIEVGTFNTQFAWQLTRARNPSAEVTTTMQQVLTNNNIDLTRFSTTQQVCDN